jgi:hypothetical protein
MRAAVRADLDRLGYAHVSGLYQQHEYRALAESLGRVVGVERIAIREGHPMYVFSPGPVPLHTDQPEVDVVAWWCEKQDDLDGASLLLDSRPFLERLPDELRRKLHDVRLLTRSLGDGSPQTMAWPVLQSAADGPTLFYTPWLPLVSPSPEDERAFVDLGEAVARAAQNHTIAIRLVKGDALFIENRRMLHGRGAIAHESGRLFHRSWLVYPAAAPTHAFRAALEEVDRK